MSTDWIKMRCNLRTHPKVVRMASALNADKLRVVGGLHAVWSIFDEHSADGFLDGYTFKALDESLGWKGFSQAMAAIGWLLDVDGTGLETPRFEEHNGQSAKRRAMETERKRLEREQEKAAAEAAKALTEAGQMSASHADKHADEKRTREREREEKKRTPPTPKGEVSPGFADFWASWPSSTRKGGKAECAKLWRSKGLEAKARQIVAHVQAMALTEGWTKQGGQFVPAPAVYLRGERWDGSELALGQDVFAGSV